MKLHHSILLVMGCLFYNVASAEQPGSAKNTALFTKYNCLVCHNPTGKRKAGPSFKMVADRYAGNAQAVDMLVKKVRSGGSGSWGPMPIAGYSRRSQRCRNQAAGNGGAGDPVARFFGVLKSVLGFC